MPSITIEFDEKDKPADILAQARGAIESWFSYYRGICARHAKLCLGGDFSADTEEEIAYCEKEFQRLGVVF